MSLDPAVARQLLDDERRRLLGDQAQVDHDRGEEAGDALSRADQNPANLGTETEDAERDEGLRDDLEYLLGEVGAALGRLDDGSYGLCQRCGRQISDERLRAVPATRYCYEHQTDAARFP